MAALRSHIDALNSHCASSAFSQIKLDEDTVSIQVKAEGCKGTVNISLHERSSYPRTGGLAFADGSDQLVAAVESVSEAIGEKASLDHVLRLLSSKPRLGRSEDAEAAAGRRAHSEKAVRWPTPNELRRRFTPQARAHDQETQRHAARAIGNVAANASCQKEIGRCGGLRPLVKCGYSRSPELQQLVPPHRREASRHHPRPRPPPAARPAANGSGRAAHPSHG